MRLNPPMDMRLHTGRDACSVIQVLCGESELQEYGVIIEVGQRVERVGTRRDWTYYGNDLDSIQWQFDQYAEEVTGSSVTITGNVTAIAAVYVRATQEPSGGWTAAPDSSWLEPLTTTRDTRQPTHEIQWGPPSEPDEDGNSYQGGTFITHEGDELLSGWLFTLDHEHITHL